MGYNQAHEDTFKPILELHGLSKEIAAEVASHLSRIDNNQQDQLIKSMVCDYFKRLKQLHL